MNLFVAGWNLSDDDVAAVRVAFEKAVQGFPQLDPLTRSEHRHGTAFLTALSHASAVIGARRYVASDPGHALIYDGCPYDRSGAVQAHDATELDRYWLDLPGALEGQFAIVRIGTGPTLDLLVDPLGLEQVYAAASGGSWFLSNSARLLALAVPEARTPDTTAADLYMTLGWTTADRTWHTGVRVVPGGQHWAWSGTATDPRRNTYYSARAVARDAARNRSAVPIDELATDLEAGLRILDDSRGPLVASLSGGRDSRSVLALILHAGIAARYYTLGVEESADVDIAKEVALELGLDHDVVYLDDADVLERWDELAFQLGAQTDGMVSLREIIRLALRPTEVGRLGIEIWGAAGGIAKGNWMNRRLFVGRNGADHIVPSMYGRIADDYGGLVTPAAQQVAREFMRRYFDEAVADGIDPLDVPALFSTEERSRRWDYGNARLHTPGHDVFSPFATRAWVRASFSVSPLQRFSSPYHFQISKTLVPELHTVRYDKPWRSQMPWLNLLDLTDSKRRIRARLGRDHALGDRPSAAVGDWRRADRFAWFEAKREDLRSLCLDHPHAAAWHGVDRVLFERVMASAADPEERRRRVTGLLYFAAPFYYETSLGSA